MNATRQPTHAWLIAVLLGAGLTVAIALVGLLLSGQPPPDTAPPAEAATAATPSRKADPPASAAEEPLHTAARQEMVDRQLRGRDITDAKVLEVMGRVPRHRFVPDDLADVAYIDRPLPIGHGQTISQPYIVALMTQVVNPGPKSRALDIGTGSGYQAAVLAELCQEVYSIEIVKPLADSSQKRLADLGYKNITVRCGDGYRGWPEKVPFDVIVVAAAPDHVPQPLVEQLAPGGRLIIPVGTGYQDLLLIEKQADGTVHRKSIIPVMFVPMRGEAEKHPGK